MGRRVFGFCLRALLFAEIRNGTEIDKDGEKVGDEEGEERDGEGEADEADEEDEEKEDEDED